MLKTIRKRLKSELVNGESKNEGHEGVKTPSLRHGGLYIHIPFCKQACHYCDFHFSTSMGKKSTMITALQKELVMRKAEFKDEVVATIYFGGGTPSVLKTEEINQIINTVYANYQVIDNPEITLEANPDDLSSEKIEQLAISPINRLSIGIQSFFDEDLKLMNRAHSAIEAEKSLSEAVRHFDNISIDLIWLKTPPCGCATTRIPARRSCLAWVNCV